jgi:hypothetical protein
MTTAHKFALVLLAMAFVMFTHINWTGRCPETTLWNQIGTQLGMVLFAIGFAYDLSKRRY